MQTLSIQTIQIFWTQQHMYIILINWDIKQLGGVDFVDPSI